MNNEVLDILKRLESKVDTGLKTLDNDLKRTETKVDERTQTLRSLEHSAEINRAEHDKLAKLTM